MIIVVPTDGDVGLVDTTHIVPFLNEMNMLSKRITKYNYELDEEEEDACECDSSLENDDTFAAVNKVGDYQISVVFSVEDILSKIDWTIFHKPSDLDRRLATIEDKTLFPFDSKAIIIASATSSIDNSGFGIVYKDPTCFVPVCHESTNPCPHYDVCIQELYQDRRPPISFHCNGHRCYQYKDGRRYIPQTGYLTSFTAPIRNEMVPSTFNMVWSRSGQACEAVTDVVHNFRTTSIKGYHTNQNLFLTK
jgi:hypothetical protein